VSGVRKQERCNKVAVVEEEERERVVTGKDVRVVSEA